MNFQRFDSYNIVNDKIYFKTHFLLLDSTLVDTKFNLQTDFSYSANNNNNSNLRKLDTNKIKKTFSCEQYGISSVSDLNQEKTSDSFLVNYLCDSGLDNENYQVLSINKNDENLTISEPYSREITANYFSTNDIDISKMSDESLEEELKNSKVYTYVTNDAVDFEYNCEQNYYWFEVSGNLNENTDEDNFSFVGNLFDNSSKKMECVIYENTSLTNTILHCSANGNDFYRQKALIQDGIYSSENNANKKIIIYNKENIRYNEAYCNDVPYEKDSSSSGLSKASIAGIVVAIILIILVIGVIVVFYVFKNKDNDDESVNTSTKTDPNKTENKSSISEKKEEKNDNIEKDASDGQVVGL